MLNNLYILKIPDNNILKKLIRYHICFTKITYYDNYILVAVDYLNYANILRYMKIFNIELVSVKGLKHYKYLLKKYFIFLVSIILGFIWLIFLSNIIFDVRIMTNDKEIAQILNLELNYYNIRKYKMVVSFKEKESIKRYNQGEALFVCGSRRMRINVIATQEELDSFGSGGGL